MVWFLVILEGCGKAEAFGSDCEGEAVLTGLGWAGLWMLGWMMKDDDRGGARTRYLYTRKFVYLPTYTPSAIDCP